MKLNNNQILFLEFLLKNKGIKHKETQGEILDHLASNIEEKMNDNIIFHQALDLAIEEFGEDNFHNISKNQHYLFQQKIKKNMKRITLFILIISSPIFYLFGNQLFQENKNEKIIAEINNPEILQKNIPIINEISHQGNTKLINQEPPEAYPVIGDYPIVATFGKRMHPIQKVMKHHNGIDIKAPIGTPVVASSDGIIVKVEKKEIGYGNHIVIKHDKTYKSMYAHLSMIDVKVGETVSKGQKIGEVGTSGSSLNPHLHYEVIKEGKKVNPEKYISM